MKETPIEKFSKDYSEVVKSFIALRRESAIQGITINSVSLTLLWTSKYPKLLADIKNVLEGKLMGFKVEE